MAIRKFCKIAILQNFEIGMQYQINIKQVKEIDSFANYNKISIKLKKSNN